MKKVFLNILGGLLITHMSINSGCSCCKCCGKRGNNSGNRSNKNNSTSSQDKPVPGPGKPFNPGSKPGKLADIVPVNNNVTVNIVKKEGVNNNAVANITIDKNITVADLKFEIFKVNNSLLSKNQNLKINNILLVDDSKTLAEYNVVNGTQVIVEMNSTPEDINIEAKTLTGKTYSISVKPSETIRELKEIISKKEGCTSEDFRLIFNKQQLNDDKLTIADYKIANSDLVHILHNIKSPDIKIGIREATGNEHDQVKYININKQATIGEFKNIVSTIIKLEKNQFYLYFAGKILEDNKTFSYYSIQDETVLYYQKNV